ncbi:MAG: MFS transporter [Planctomycetota bacterium]|nr:MFS transporter [Planctomycetota bacterium]
MAAHSGDSPTTASDPPRGALLVVFLTVFIDLLGFGIVLPVMPRQAEPYLQTLGLPPAGIGAMIGVLFSVFSLMQFVFSPIWGRLSDRIGRRPLLILSLLGSVIFYALYGYAVTFPESQATTAITLMLLSRIGAGIAGASVGTAAAVIADCTPPEKRARGMALIGIAFGAGFTLGPLIAYFGLALFRQQPWGVGALASLLSFVALLIAVFVFRETRRPGVRNAKEFVSFSRTAAVLGIPAIGALVLTYFLSIFAFANFEATLARLTKQSFGMSDDDNFLVFAFIGVVLMIAGGLYRPLAKRLPEGRLLAAGVALMILGLGGLGLVALAVHRQAVAGNVPQLLENLFFAVSAVSVVGFAFVNPSVSALLSKGADPDEQGEVLGVNQSFASLGRILGPFLGSLLFSLHDSRTLPFVAAVAVLCVVAALLPRATASSVSPGHTAPTGGGGPSG